MYVAFPADCRGIAKARGDVLNRGSKIELRLGGAVEALEFIQRHRGQHGARPCPKILRRDVFPVICFK